MLQKVALWPNVIAVVTCSSYHPLSDSSPLTTLVSRPARQEVPARAASQSAGSTHVLQRSAGSAPPVVGAVFPPVDSARPDAAVAHGPDPGTAIRMRRPVRASGLRPTVLGSAAGLEQCRSSPRQPSWSCAFCAYG